MYIGWFHAHHTAGGFSHVLYWFNPVLVYIRNGNLEAILALDVGTLEVLF